MQYKTGVGLKIEKRKGPVQVLVIDHVEKKPTANWASSYILALRCLTCVSMSESFCCCAILGTILGGTAYSQILLDGEWQPQYHEDQDSRISAITGPSDQRRGAA